VPDTPSGQRDSIRWFPRAIIEKYSAGQVAWARRRLDREARREQGVREARTGSAVPVMHGAWLQALFSYPEDGVVYDRGNGVTAAGLANWAAVLSGAGGHPLAPGRAVFGVGSDGVTEFDREQVSLSLQLGEEQGRSWYKPMDPGYQRPAGPASIEAQATFTEHEACFDWHEWCWGTGPGRPQAHHRLRGCYGGEQPVMVNRKAHPAGYGLKEPGVAWVFRTQVDLLG
jgi:hypothetical protein